MFRIPDSYHDISLKLASVLEDIGVNKQMIIKRRKYVILKENLNTISQRLQGRDRDIYHFGSRSEGTTVMGLQSDYDMLLSDNSHNVIQDWKEWKAGLQNVMLVQDKNSPPGYCMLQRLYKDVPKPLTEAYDHNHLKYKDSMVILRHTYLYIPPGGYRSGPAASNTEEGFISADSVVAFPLKSLPHEVTGWLQEQRREGKINNEMKEAIETAKCYVVPMGMKGSENEEHLWRISTSQAERCLVFNMNITQIQCYILMKLILKTYLTPGDEPTVSSFMCKNILIRRILTTPATVWSTSNLFIVLLDCLFLLRRCLLTDECPHFIYHRNNLMAGRLPCKVRYRLVETLHKIFNTNGGAFLGINIDGFGYRLGMKFKNMTPDTNTVPMPEVISAVVSGDLVADIGGTMSCLMAFVLRLVSSKEQYLKSIIRTLFRVYHSGTSLQSKACFLLVPMFCSTLGAIKASEDIACGRFVSSEAMLLVYANAQSDVASSRLKLASVLYSLGALQLVVCILKEIETEYDTDLVLPVCGCYDRPGQQMTRPFCEYSDSAGQIPLRHVIAFCIRFLRLEKKCVPHELQYEMFRSFGYARNKREQHEFWMDWAAVDSLPYMYFLQYKTYGQLNRPRDQLCALTNLAAIVDETQNLGHIETALNLLGQCLEQENRDKTAIQCYTMSLKLRLMNNAASLLVCKLLYRLWKNRDAGRV